MEFFVMIPEVSLWDFKMLSAIMSLAAVVTAVVAAAVVATETAMLRQRRR
jgi:hypothetical protein